MIGGKEYEGFFDGTDLGEDSDGGGDDRRLAGLLSRGKVGNLSGFQVGYADCAVEFGNSTAAPSDGLMIALIIFMVLDYITGLMCAVIDKKLSSAVGVRGVCKKVLISR